MTCYFPNAAVMWKHCVLQLHWDTDVILCNLQLGKCDSLMLSEFLDSLARPRFLGEALWPPDFIGHSLSKASLKASRYSHGFGHWVRVWVSENTCHTVRKFLYLHQGWYIKPLWMCVSLQQSPARIHQTINFLKKHILHLERCWWLLITKRTSLNILA